jgi:putative protein kinase ArgK-like GTPase of G3E family
MISLRSESEAHIPIIQTHALDEKGVTELVEAIRGLQSAGNGRHSGIERLRRLLASEVCNRLRQDLLESTGTDLGAQLDALSERVLKTDLTLSEAVESLHADLQLVTRVRKHAK